MMLSLTTFTKKKISSIFENKKSTKEIKTTNFRMSKLERETATVCEQLQKTNSEVTNFTLLRITPKKEIDV